MFTHLETLCNLKSKCDIWHPRASLFSNDEICLYICMIYDSGQIFHVCLYDLFYLSDMFIMSVSVICVIAGLIGKSLCS